MVNVVGLGYIGLPTALMLSASGIDVVGTDCNERLVQRLSRGEVSFREKGQDALMEEALRRGIRFSTAYHAAGVYIIAVQTPCDAASKKADTSFVESALEGIARVCPPDALVVVESTVPPGTCARLKLLLRERGRTDIRLAHAPERVIPGDMIGELVRNDRVLGAEDEGSAETLTRLYASFCKGRITVTDIKTAEMVKVVENTYRDINIAFANELARTCRAAGVDTGEVIRCANLHPRVDILRPGPGVGGHCIPVDPWFLAGEYPDQTPLIHAARQVNDSMPEYVLERILDIMAQHGMTDLGAVGLYGLTYKENIDDTRLSPARQLMDVIRRRMGDVGVSLYDPLVGEDILPGQVHDLDLFLGRAGLVVILTAHEEIVAGQALLKDKLVLDTTGRLTAVRAYGL